MSSVRRSSRAFILSIAASIWSIGSSMFRRLPVTVFDVYGDHLTPGVLQGSRQIEEA